MLGGVVHPYLNKGVLLRGDSTSHSKLEIHILSKEK